MIICPNCNHENPDEANQCELCYSPLPATSNCPECGTAVQADATFCGQCGHNLKASTPSGTIPPTIVSGDSSEEAAPVESAIPPTVGVFTQPEVAKAENKIPETELASPSTSPEVEEELEVTDPAVAEQPSLEETPDIWSSVGSDTEETLSSDLPDYNTVEPPQGEDSSSSMPHFEVETEPEPEFSSTTPAAVAPSSGSPATQLQLVQASLLHVQTDTKIEIPQQLSVVHIGKPNSQVPPDVDVSGFPNSEIVSRIHADIRVEGDAFFLEDMGSSNGTYVNHTPLLTGDRHRLRPGDRIALGKGDKVTFIFQAQP